MAITLEHFCTKTGKSIIVDGKPLTETIEHCLAEYFAPNQSFKLGTVYQESTTESDLRRFFEQGLSLEFAADDRFYFMNEALREKIFDQPHFGAAYGSNMFTPCKSFGERENLRVLVVDANTGENGGVIPTEEAIKLVGDGDGKIHNQLHEDLGNQPQTPFQTRFGIKQRQQGLEPNSGSINQIWQLGKGTFAPRDLSRLGNGYDLVISTDQLKGRVRGGGEGEIGRGGEGFQSSPPSPTALVPGEYTMTIGIGNKTDAYYGITSTGAQFWNSFPRGVKGDVLPRLEKRLEELKDMTNDPRKIAQDYINSMDARYKHQIQNEQESLIDFDNLNVEGLDKLIDSAFGSGDQNIIYRILKADLEGHCQILELPKIVEKLQEHWRKQYMDCATGRFIKFDSAMAQTCHDLADNQVSYPNLPDGEEVIVYRGPTANSNTVNVFVNKHLPNEPLDKGCIKMSPKALFQSLSDCDGDRMAIALASEFPHTTAEIKEKQLEENRYAEIVKLAKKAYEGCFKQIALQAMENKLGLIANLCMKGIALENECLCVPKEEAFKLMVDISTGAVKMLAAENNLNKPVSYPDNLKEQIIELAEFFQDGQRQKIDISKYNNLADYNHSCTERNLPTISEKDIEKFLEKSHNFYHDVVGILGGQLQIEVDRGKSANRSDPEIVSACKVIVKNPDIAPWVEERKIEEVYENRPINIKGNGAIDMMARMTNEAWKENALVARSTQQFQDLFNGVEFTQQQKDKAIEIKKTYDYLINRAIEISREASETSSPRIIATSATGNTIEIIGLGEFKHPNAFDINRNLDIAIVENDKLNTKVKNKWIAVAPVFDSDSKPELKNGNPKYMRLGYIASESANKYPDKMKKWEELTGLTKEVLPGLAPSQVRAAFRQVREFATATRESIPDSQKEAIVSAMWQISTASKEDPERGFKKTSAVFAIFGEELVGRLDKLQFTKFAVVGTHKPSNEHSGRTWVGEKVECRIEQAPDPTNPTQNKRWLVAEGKKLGVFRSESAQLPIGTSFEAEIVSPPSASVIITSTQGNQLKVGQLKKYAFPNQQWKGEDGVVTINVSGSGKAVTPVAFIDDKPLGVIDKESFTLLTEKLSAKGIKAQRFKFKGTLSSAPATIANIKVDSETVQYPEVWTKGEPLVKDKEISLLSELKPLLKDKYRGIIDRVLLHDDEASLGAVTIKSEYFESFMQEKDKNAEIFKTLSGEIDKKFGVESFIGIAQKENLEELYFCVSVPTSQKTAIRITDNLNFPLEYDQLENGQRIKFIAIPLDELREVISKAESKIKLRQDEVVAAKPSNIKYCNEKVVTNQTDLSKGSTGDASAQQPSNLLVREDWEKNMLKLALASLKANPANTGEEMQTATFVEGKYRVIHHVPSQMLRIVDEENHRGTLYKVQRGKLPQVSKFSSDEKRCFELSKVELDMQLGKPVPKGLLRE